MVSFFVVLGVFASLNPAVWSSLGGKTCHRWEWRSVPLYQVNHMQAIEMAQRVPTYEVEAIPGVSGVALVGVTIIEREAGDETHLHETIHHLQFESEGLFRYSITYAGDFVRGLYHGCGLYESYQAVRYEMQARDAVRVAEYSLLEDMAAIREGVSVYADAAPNTRWATRGTRVLPYRVAR